MDFSKQTGQLLLLLLLASVAFWLLESHQVKTIQQLTSGTKDDQPSAFIIDSHYVTYNSQGAIATELFSPEALYYDDAKRVVTKAPKFLLTTAGGRKMTLDANQGVFFPDDEILELQGQVNARQETPELNAWHLTTEALTVNSHLRFISTNQAVTITLGSDQLQAVGLNAWIDERKVELLSNVRGRYALSPSRQ